MGTGDVKDRARNRRQNQKGDDEQLTVPIRSKPSSPRKRSGPRKIANRLTLENIKRKISPFAFPATSASSAASSRAQTPAQSSANTPRHSPPVSPRNQRRTSTSGEETKIIKPSRDDTRLGKSDTDSDKIIKLQQVQVGQKVERELTNLIGQKRLFTQRDTSGSDSAEAAAARRRTATIKKDFTVPAPGKRTFSQRDTSSSNSGNETKYAKNDHNSGSSQSGPESYIDTTSEGESRAGLTAPISGSDKHDTSFIPSEEWDS